MGRYFLEFMCPKTVPTTLSQLSQALTRLTPVQEDTKMSILQKNIWIGPEKLSSLHSSYKSRTPVVLVTYPHAFAVEEAKSLVDSSDRLIVGAFSQKYLNHSQYGIGSGKAEQIKEFVRESKAEQIVVDEHLTSRQIYNLEKLALYIILVLVAPPFAASKILEASSVLLLYFILIHL